MPPRKRARVSEAASPIQKTPEPTSRPTDEDLLNDPWTDEEEIGLFKGLIKWKPTGIHKHFRMLQLRDYLLENRYIHPRSVHTQVPGIWQKLQSLYDLEALDQREDARQLSDLSEDQEEDDEEEASDDVYSLAANKIHKQSFDLPYEEYRDQIWAQRFPQDDQKGKDSPPAISGLNMSEQAPIKFTASFSIEPEEVATPPRRPRGRPPKGSGRAIAVPAATARRSKRQAESVATGSEVGSETVEPEEAEDDAEEDDNESEDEDEEEEEEEEDDDDNEDDEEEASQTSVPTTRGRGRGRGAPRGRPRGRRR